MAGKVKLSNNSNVAIRLLNRVARVADECKIPYWLEGGTLLGIIRENRLLPWDNDLDISMKDIDEETICQLIKALKKEGLRVRVRRYEMDYPFASKNQYRLLKVREKHSWFSKSPIVLDVFFKTTINNEIHWLIKSTPKKVPAHLIHELTTVDFSDYNYKVPVKHKEYLTYRYGEWKVVKKDWNTFEDDNAINSDKESLLTD